MQDLIGVRWALISAITTSSVLKKLMGVFAENVMAIASAPAEDRTMVVSPTGGD